MTERTTVALLFDDDELGTQLRQALQERGAEIVHESALGALDQAQIEQLSPDVLVVNLDDSLDENPDALYELIDSGRARVVFNDAQATRSLKGWDRARWARHFAVKVLAAGDIDPPRPKVNDDAISETVARDADASVDIVAVSQDEHAYENQVAKESEASVAELALLLAEDPAPPDPDTGHNAPKHSSRCSPVSGDEEVVGAAAYARLIDPSGWSPHARTAAGRDDRSPDRADSPPRSETASATAGTRLHESWSLVEVGEISAQGTADDHFGIEKLSAAEYLAPAADPTSATEELIMSLERMSLEESVAPQLYRAEEPSSDGMNVYLDSVLVLGATADSAESVQYFLSLLPGQLRCAIILVHHLRDHSAANLVQKLMPYCSLPLRVASNECLARAGEVLVVPAGQQLTMLRDGSVDLQPTDDAGSSRPSIEATSGMLAKVFSHDVLALVFAGSATDAVAGCQAIHDRGGRVWVEQTNEDDFADTISGVLAKRLATCIAPPHELAMRVIEEYR